MAIPPIDPKSPAGQKLLNSVQERLRRTLGESYSDFSLAQVETGVRCCTSRECAAIAARFDSCHRHRPRLLPTARCPLPAARRPPSRM